MRIDLSVIVVSYETADLLVECLDALESARGLHPEFPFEVIVVDNGSRDGSADRARSHRVAPRLVAGLRNRGFAAAVNSGLRLRRGRHVLLLNSDVRIEPNLLIEGVEILDAHEELGVMGPMLVHANGAPQRSVHPLPSLRSELVPEWLQPERWRGRVRTAGTGEAYQEVEAVRGAVFFVRGSLAEKVGEFDEGYFFFLEETDYCARVRAAGFRVGTCAALRAVHRLGASSKRRAPLATRIEYHRSLDRFLRRRCGRGTAAAVRIARTLRNAISVGLLSAPALVFPALRGRWTERFGLMLWHLRGRPAVPTLADSLERSAD